jgi:ATP-binding cassette subfamily F protein 3
MLSLDHVTMQYGGRVLFDDVSIMIGPHDRLGLVGSNGAGKSTLLKIITGSVEPESGRVNKAEFVTAGYLPQDGIIASGSTLYGEVESSFDSVMEVQRELDEVLGQLSTLPTESPEYAEAIEIYGELQHKLEELDAFRMKSKIETVLMGLGFGVDDFTRQTEEFSGGWQMRIALAKLLLKEPSLLLLDEPTNHLDIESLQWLEEYLQRYNGAVALVSHDRAFLDSLTTKTLSLSLGKAEFFQGNYSFFERESALRKEQLLSAQKNQEKQMKHTQEFIDRFRYKASKASQVQSRIKMLEKMDKIETGDEEEEIDFHFPSPQPSGVRVMELRNITKRFGDHTVFHNLNYTIERGDRIAIVGVNGAGKSTFSRIVAGVEPLSGGERIPGHNVILSYFAQHQAEELDQSKEALEILDDVAVGAVRTKLRTILGTFLFHGDDVFKKVSVLSGGEKSRLAMAKMLLLPANVLVMDEPTNHLDMRSKAILQRALQEYEGTMIIVSHDRAFLDPLVNKTLEISKTGVRTFLGNVAYYLEKKRAEQSAASRGASAAARGASAAAHDASTGAAFPMSASGGRPRAGNAQSEKERKRLEAERRQQLSTRLKPLKERLAKVEADIKRREDRKEEIEQLLADPEFYKRGDEVKKVQSEFQEIQKTLLASYDQWGKISQEIEAAQNVADAPSSGAQKRK